MSAENRAPEANGEDTPRWVALWVCDWCGDYETGPAHIALEVLGPSGVDDRCPDCKAGGTLVSVHRLKE